MKNILGILILPFALMIIAIIYIAAQVKYVTKEIILKENEK